MAILAKPLMAWEMGGDRRGKYTCENILAFAIKVFFAAVRQVLKYPQKRVPDI
tara:strand:+ start:253 stop:411 length:159 start_codon:yes stop_codon:yes gene_type:complete